MSAENRFMNRGLSAEHPNLALLFAPAGSVLYFRCFSMAY